MLGGHQGSILRTLQTAASQPQPEMAADSRRASDAAAPHRDEKDKKSKKDGQGRRSDEDKGATLSLQK